MSMLTLEQPIFDGRGCPTGTTLWKSTPQADLHGTNPKDQRSPGSRRGNAGFKEEWPRAVGCLRGNNTMRERERRGSVVGGLEVERHPLLHSLLLHGVLAASFGCGGEGVGWGRRSRVWYTALPE